jgi:hypothetical protein
MGNKNNWDADAMKGTLISDMEQEVRDGIRKTNTEEQGGEKHQPSALSPQPSEQEPTKGVQTYIPMSDYLRLNTIKCHRGETIGNLVAQAIALWLDVQEGKQKVSEVI